MKTKKELIDLIKKNIEGQGNQVDLGGVLAEVLMYLMDNAPDPLIFTNIDEVDGTIKIVKTGNPTEKKFEVNDGSGWKPYTEGTDVAFGVGQDVAFRSTDNIGFSASSSAYRSVSMDVKTSVKGSVEGVGTMASNGYLYMFNGCTSLVNAPELPATTLASSCYAGMFNGCTSLQTVKCMATSLGSSYSASWLQGVSPTGTFYKDPSYTPSTRDANTIPSGWDVQDWEAA